MLNFNAEIAKIFLTTNCFKFAKAFEFVEFSISLSEEHDDFFNDDNLRTINYFNSTI